jgi:MoaA/NifB/PqqE/SkfB family radical SAM enzyme
MAYVRRLQPHEFDPWRDRAPLLSRLDIELTERCNNNCIHCYINRPERDAAARAREMPTAFVQDLLSQAAGLGCLTVRFTGGEPLLRDDFADLYVFARRLGIRVLLFTNGRLITPALAALLARIPPGQPVEITVYGMTAPSCDAATGAKGAFDEFRRGVDLLRQFNVPFIVKQAILPPNRGEVIEFEAWAATLPGMDEAPAYAMNFDLRARRDNPAKNRLIETLRLTPDDTVATLARNVSYLKTMRAFARDYMVPPGDRLFVCGAGHGTCVDAYGVAQMCMLMRHPDTVYDLRGGSGAPPGAGSGLGDRATGDGTASPLRYALTEFFPRLRELRATNPDYLARCARCFLKGLCEQCPAKSWAEHGTLDTPVEYLCQVAHAQARYLGLLAPGEDAWALAPESRQERIRHFVGERA